MSDDGLNFVIRFSPAPAESPPSAAMRAKRLLYEHLTPEQYASYHHHGFFYSTASDGRRFSLRAAAAPCLMTAVRSAPDLSDWVPVRTYCVQFDYDNIEHRPWGHGQTTAEMYDLLLAQKLWIENDVESFLEVANK
jgi:hypothetical protein